MELKETEAQALVVGSSLVVASADVPVTTRQDLINCTLFAQLAAGGEVADPSDVVNWYAAYFRGLTALGWAQSDVQFEQYDAGSKGLEANKAIIEVLTVLLGPQAAALAVVKTTLDALASMDAGQPLDYALQPREQVGEIRQVPSGHSASRCQRVTRDRARWVQPPCRSRR